MTISLCEEIPGIIKDIDRFVKRKADRYGETAFDGEEFTLIAWPEETTDEDVFAIDAFRMDGIHIGESVEEATELDDVEISFDVWTLLYKRGNPMPYDGYHSCWYRYSAERLAEVAGE